MDTLLNYRNIKWILFTAIMMTVPSLLFLVMVIMFMPVVFSLPAPSQWCMVSPFCLLLDIYL